MSKFVSAAKDLPKDPGDALVTFGERAMGLYKSDEKISLEDSEFIVQFIEKFTAKFDIPLPVFTQTDSLAGKIVRRLDWINIKFKSEFVRSSVSIEVDDLIHEFLDNQGDTFGLARLNEEEKAKYILK